MTTLRLTHKLLSRVLISLLVFSTLTALATAAWPPPFPDEPSYLSYLYDCDTLPEDAPDGGWEIYTLDPEVTCWSDGELLYIDGYDPYPPDRGSADFYRVEHSIASAEYYALEANMYVEQGGGWLTDFGFGASDGVKDVSVWGSPRYESVLIFTDTGGYGAEADLTTLASYRLEVDKTHADPAQHVVNLYRDGDLLITAPYSELPDAATSSFPLTNIVGFGSSDSDTVWDYVTYEIGRQLVVRDTGTPTLLWLDQFGTSVDDEAYGIAVDSLHNVYVTGARGYGGFLRKYDSEGVEQWTRQFGTDPLDAGYGIAVDSQDNIYITGCIDGTGFVRKYISDGGRQWTQHIGPSGRGDKGRGVAVDSQDNVYITGIVYGALPGQTHQGRTDVFARKYDSSGEEQWTRQFGSSELDSGYGIAVDSFDNIYITGDINYDVFVVKFDSDGSPLWTRHFGTSGPDVGRGVAVDSQDNVYITGYVSLALPGQTHIGSWDTFVRKYQKNGDILWTQQFGTINEDWAYSVAVDSSDNIYVVGFVADALPGQTHLGSWDAFVIKYHQNGDVLWTSQFGTSGPDVGRGVAVDSQDNVYITGYVSGALPGQTYHGRTDVFVRKYDSSGEEQWTRQFGTGERDVGFGVAVDSADNIYVTGSVEGVLPGQADRLSRDAFVRKYDSNGVEQWTRQFGSYREDDGFGIVVDSHNNVYGTGRINDDVFIYKMNSDGDIQWTLQTGPSGYDGGFGIAVDSFDHVYVTGSIDDDVFVYKYYSDGSILWTQQFGTSMEDAGFGIAVDSYDNVYITGYVSGALPGQTHLGFYDVFVRKYDSSGEEQWTRQFGSIVDDVGEDVSVDSADNIYITGHVDDKIFVRKYDPDGVVQWTRQFGASFPEGFAGVTVDSEANVYVTGYVTDALPGQTHIGKVDAFVRKYDSNGVEQWTQQFGTTEDDFGLDVAIDSSDLLYITGATEGAFPDQTNMEEFDVFITQYGNTPEGNDIEANFPDADVTVTFDSIIEYGQTTVEQYVGGPSPSSGFMLGTPPVYYEITTTATYEGTIHICIHYDDTQFVNELDLRLMQKVDGYHDVTTDLDTVNNIICGEATHFSGFAIMETCPSISEVIDDIDDQVDQSGVATSLTAKLRNAWAALEYGNIDDFQSILNALINEVEAQSGKHVSSAYAYTLLKVAHMWMNDPELAG